MDGGGQWCSGRVLSRGGEGRSGGEGKDGAQAGVGSWGQGGGGGKKGLCHAPQSGHHLPVVRTGGCEWLWDLTKLTL